MKKIFEKNFVFIFLILLGLTILTLALSSTFNFMIYIFYFIFALFAILCGIKLNKIIEELKILTHEKVCFYSIIEISIYTILYVAISGYNAILTTILSIAFYLSLFTIISTFIYMVCNSLEKKDKKYINYLFINLFVFLITWLLTYLSNKQILNNDLFRNIITIYYMISTVIFVFYVSTVALYKGLKIN